MRHKKKGNQLNRTSSHRRAMLSNLVTSLIDKGALRTTHAIAKEGQRLADRVVTWGKKNTLHTRRLAVAALHDRDIVKKLFEEVAPQFKDRNGGYTRVIKLGMRKGDGALLSQLEFVGASIERGKASTGSKTGKTKEKREPAAGGEAKPNRRKTTKKTVKKKAKEGASTS